MVLQGKPCGRVGRRRDFLERLTFCKESQAFVFCAFDFRLSFAVSMPPSMGRKWFWNA